MSNDKCCGNCKHFKDEDIEGFSYCEIEHGFKCCDEVCVEHEAINNCWTEITPDNIDKIRKSKNEIVIMNPKEWDVPEMLYSIKADSLVLYSEWGGYYYYVLPELKIE